jgi:hypothetical protein
MALEQIVNRVSEQLSQVLPPGVRQLRGDLKKTSKQYCARRWRAWSW